MPPTPPSRDSADRVLVELRRDAAGEEVNAAACSGPAGPAQAAFAAGEIERSARAAEPAGAAGAADGVVSGDRAVA